MAEQPRAVETKCYIQSIDFRRGTEEERLRIGSDLSARLLYGPLTIEKVEPVNGQTRVWFVNRLKFESNLLNISGEFAGFHLFPGQYEEKDVQSETFMHAMMNGTAPYIQEIIAVLTGRSGINPIILPLPSKALQLQQGEN